MTIAPISALPKAAKPADTADTAALAAAAPATAPFVPDDDLDAKSAYEAVMQALASPAVPVDNVPRAIETEVRPQAKQAAAMPSSQPMHDIVGEAAKTAATADKAANAHFISRYHALTLYVDVGFREQHQGIGIVRNVPIRFKEGRFITENSEVAKALREHPRFNSMFQETQSAQLAAFVAGAAKARQMLRNQITAGPASSNDSNDFAQMGKDAELNAVEQKLFSF